MAFLGTLNSSGFNALSSGVFTLSFSKDVLSEYLFCNNWSYKNESVRSNTLGISNLINIQFGLNTGYYDYVYFQNSNQYNYSIGCFLINYHGQYYLSSGTYRISNVLPTSCSSTGESYFINGANGSFKFAFRSNNKQAIGGSGSSNYSLLQSNQIYYYSPFNGENLSHQQVSNIIDSYLIEDGFGWSNGVSELSPHSFMFRLASSRNTWYDHSDWYSWSSITWNDFFNGITKTNEYTGSSNYDFDYQGTPITSPKLARFPVSAVNALLLNYDKNYGNYPVPSSYGFNFFTNFSGSSQYFGNSSSLRIYNLSHAYDGLYIYNLNGNVAVNRNDSSDQIHLFYSTNNSGLYLINSPNELYIDAKTNNLTLANLSDDVENEFKLYEDNPIISSWFWGLDSYNPTIEFYGFPLTESNINNYFIDSSYLDTLVLNDYYKSAFNFAMDFSIASISLGVVLSSLIALSMIIFLLKRLL